MLPKGSEPIYTFNGPVEVPYVVDLENGYSADFTPVFTHPKFQRTRRIRQLPLIGEYVVGAVHSRYEHLLGTFYLAAEAIRNPNVRLSRYEKFLLLSIAALHDVGYGPYSHVYDILAKSNGLPDHKEMSARIIETDLADALKEAAGPEFFLHYVAEDVARELRTRGILGRLVSAVDGLDKMDYIFRDGHHCAVGKHPDIRTLMGHLYFDGQVRATDISAEDALREFFEAYASNYAEVYLNKDVERLQAFLMRAIGGSIGLMAGYSFTDEQLDEFLTRDETARRILERIKDRDWRERWKPAISIRPRDYVKPKEHGGAVIERASDAEIAALKSRIRLPMLTELEHHIRTETLLDPEELAITFSPEIPSRANFDDPMVTWTNGGDRHFESFFRRNPGYREELEARIGGNYSIDLVVDEKAANRAVRFVRKSGGLKSMLLK